MTTKALFRVPVVLSRVNDFMEGTVCGKWTCTFGPDHSLQWLSETCGGTELLLPAPVRPHRARRGQPLLLQALEIGFLYVRIEGQSFTGEFYDAAGTLLFTRTFTK